MSRLGASGAQRVALVDFDVKTATVSALLRTYRSVLGELKRREIVRTSNAPTGDLAELLVAKAFDGELAPNSEKSFDVWTRDGRRIQVKARVVARDAPGERQLSTVRSWGFTHLAVVLFGPDYSITRAALIPVAVAQGAASEDGYVGGSRIMASDALLEGPDVEDVTDRIAAAFRELDAEYV